MQVYYHTFGCKVNSYEIENILQQMESKEHVSVSKIKDADVCIINSCTVTHEADSKLIQLVHRIRRDNPKAIVVIAGCYSQLSPAIMDLADIAVGTSNKTKIPDLIENYNGTKLNAVIPHYKGEAFESMFNRGNSRKTRAEIKIQDGCDRFCTYCDIPYARGRARSKPLADIEAEAKQLVLDGHKELCLVGINLGCYGQDIGLTLADAVEAVCNTSGADRVRLGSLEAELLSEDIIARLGKCTTLCPHFHLSLQSGCDKVLKDMGRKYVKAEYFTIVSCFRKHFPNCAITTDIMVGFPGETDDDFNESLEFVKSIGFADGHVFPYSPREGTVAAKRGDQIPPEIKALRAKAMSEAVAEARQNYLQSMIGKTVSVLFEKEKDSAYHSGHSDNYLFVKVNRFTDTLRYQIKEVLITGVEDDVCYGKIVE